MVKLRIVLLYTISTRFALNFVSILSDDRFEFLKQVHNFVISASRIIEIYRKRNEIEKIKMRVKLESQMSKRDLLEKYYFSRQKIYFKQG